MDDTEAAQPDQPAPATATLPRSAAAGIFAGAAALAVGELAGALAAPRPGPVVAIANRVIDLAPGWFVEFGKSVFGLADKPALVVGTVVIALLIGAGLGIASRWGGLRLGIAGIVAFGLLGMLAIGVDNQGGWGTAVPVSLVAVMVGVVVLAMLMARAGGGTVRRPASGDSNDKTRVIDSPVDPALSRRGFLSVAGVVGVAAVGAGAGASFLRARSSAIDARNSVSLDSALGATTLEADVLAADASPIGSIDGITPVIVPNDKFYLIDTAVLVPQVDPANWQLRIFGMVDNEVTYSYDDLLDRAGTVEPVTLSCVSNPVGGDLVGNALWQGVPLTELLDEAGIDPDATQVASRSVDGWTCGFPTEAAYDGRTAMVAIAMNDEPLPLEHGFPARLVVSGLYGYVSATKWLSEIELTTLEDFDGYWVPRGWAKLGPVKTQSRIDTPRHEATVAAGEQVSIAGVAWAPDTGIEQVEVQVDDDDWMEAQLGDSLGPDAWVQWRVRWTPTEGSHLIRVRATDSSGYTQTSELAAPAPDGATGWHTIEVSAA